MRLQNGKTARFPLARVSTLSQRSAVYSKSITLIPLTTPRVVFVEMCCWFVSSASLRYNLRVVAAILGFYLS